MEETKGVKDNISTPEKCCFNRKLIRSVDPKREAMHQKDAEENLFLRFLELDSDTVSNQSSGRTPFTTTKTLIKKSTEEFGFSIIWTHPPRIEKIEQGLAAYKAGLQIGDYIIFVNKHNVVTMPETEVLDIIQSQGDTLILEIFRRCSNVEKPHINCDSSEKIIKAINLPGNSTSKRQDKQISVSNSNVTYVTSDKLRKSKLHLSELLFNEESIVHNEDTILRKLLFQLLCCEQNFVNILNIGIQRFMQPLNERPDLISAADHRTLFQNVDELLQISEDILDQLTLDNQTPQIKYVSRIYLSKTTTICAAYKKYCTGIKKADCILVNKSRQPGSEFIAFISEPQKPRKYLDLTMFIHRPLQHFREILKLMQLLAAHCQQDTEEHKNFLTVISELQKSYREITFVGGLMEPKGQGRPLLTLQDLESRLVFTKCKPFPLAIKGRQWIFGGDLLKIEERSIRSYWTLLFNDIIIFTRSNRDRVLFITEEPLPIANIIEYCFNIRKRNTDFRITVDLNDKPVESPTGYCAPELMKTSKKGLKKKNLLLRAPSAELKAVWQNLLQRQIFLINSGLNSTPLSSPIDSPNVLNALNFIDDIDSNVSGAARRVLLKDNLKQKKQDQHTNYAQHLEVLIDEKCRILNKTGTAKESALHLANWMKGKLNSDSQHSNLDKNTRLTDEFKESDNNHHHKTSIKAYNGDIDNDNVDDVVDDDVNDNEERITYWTREQLEKRTKELNLLKINYLSNNCNTNNNDRRFSYVDEILMSDDSDRKSPSPSTTSNSQITIRSSTNANFVDNLSICMHCYNNCKFGVPLIPALSCSLKVQHSQSYMNRWYQNNSINSNNDNQINLTPINVDVDGSKVYNTKLNEHSTLNYSMSDINKSTINYRQSIQQKNKQQSKLNTNNEKSNCINNCQNNLLKQNKPSTGSSVLNSFDNSNHLYQQNNYSNYLPNTVTTEDFYNENINLTTDDVTKRDDKNEILIEDERTSSSDINEKNHRPLSKKSDESVSDIDFSPKGTDKSKTSSIISLAHSDDILLKKSAFLKSNSTSVLSKTTTNIWDSKTSHNKLDDLIKNNVENDDDDDDDDDESDISTRNKLKRFGTMSSLRMPQEFENIDDRSHDYNTLSSNHLEDCSSILKMSSSQACNANNNIQSPLINAITETSDYSVINQKSFIEKSLSLIDTYLGTWKRRDSADNTEYELTDHECTSAATSGEEVWGTPTSGEGKETEQNTYSDQTQTSPSGSNSSLNDDNNYIELMMDELLMASPLTSNTTRGLLPRQKLEPLFEEETESDEERTQNNQKTLKQDAQTESTEDFSSRSSFIGGSNSKLVNNSFETDHQITTSEAKIFDKSTKKDEEIIELPTQDDNKLSSYLNPREEMRLALNQDGDATIVNNQKPNFNSCKSPDSNKTFFERKQSKTSFTAYFQQRNSKQDTPTLSRKNQTSQRTSGEFSNTVNSFIFMSALKKKTTDNFKRIEKENVEVKQKFSMLEQLARQEQMNSASRNKSSSSSVRNMLKPMDSKVHPFNHSQSSFPKQTEGIHVLNVLCKTNTENQQIDSISQPSSTNSVINSKDSDKSSLNRRFWKQLSKRRQTNCSPNNQDDHSI